MAVLIQVTQYQAEDGSLFLTAAEADAHDFKLKNGETIRIAAESFVNARQAIDRSRNMQLNTISEFLAFYLPWVEAGSVFVERTKEDSPKPVAVEGTEAKAEADAEVAAVEPAPAVDGEQDAQPMF